MFPAGLSFAVRAGERAASRSGQEGGNLGPWGRSQRCLAGPAAVILYSSRQSRSRPPKVRSCGNTEAVFSSSGNRIRASQAKAAVAGPSIASGSSSLQTTQVLLGWRSTPQIAESLFAVAVAVPFPSHGRICGTPRARISRLPVCHAQRSDRNASMPTAPSGAASRQLAASVGFRHTRLLGLRASPDAGCAAGSSRPSHLSSGRWKKGSERRTFSLP
jgi:hypothetical protein